MNNRRFRIFQKLIYLGAFFLIAGCNPSSNLPMGFELNQKENDHPIGVLKEEVYFPAAAQFYNKEVVSGSNNLLLIGENAGFKSILLFRFFFRNLPHPDSSVIKSVELILHHYKAAGDSLNQQLSLTAYKMNGKNPDWDETKITWSSFNNDFNETPLSAPVVATGTYKNKLVIPLDPIQLTKANGVLDSTFIKTGFCVRYQTESNLNLIKSFYSRSVSDTVHARLRIISTFDGETDTTDDVYGHDTYVVLNKALPQDSTSFLFLGKGVAYRSWLAFDVSNIPENATINRARLKMVIDQTNTLPGVYDDQRLSVSPVTNWPEQAKDVKIDSMSLIYSSTVTDDTLVVDVGPMIQDWTNKQQDYRGFYLRSTSEGIDIQRISIFGIQAIPELRPKLILEYTLPPTFPN